MYPTPEHVTEQIKTQQDVWVPQSHKLHENSSFLLTKACMAANAKQSFTQPWKEQIWVSYGLSSSHVWMWQLNCEESWAPKNWCFWTVVLEKTLGSPLDCKEIQPVHPKGDQSWIFIGRTDAEAETLVLWPPHAKSWLIGKDSDAGRDWGQEEKGTTENEMAGWHHWLDGRWVWVSSRRWWWTGRPGVLQFMGSQRVGHNWATDLIWFFF